MKKVVLLGPVLALSACLDAGSDSGMAGGEGQAITSEAAFVAAVADRQIELQGQPDNNLIIASNGSITGTFGGSNLAGTWAWRDGAWCRTLSEGPRGPSPEDCQIWTMTPDGDFSVTRDRGAGGSFVYELS